MNPGCLIISDNAVAYASEIERLADEPIPATICTSAATALERYAGETIAFGNPEMIAEVLPHTPAIDWVQSSWAGITPLLGLDRSDFRLTGIKGAFGPQMSEYVIGFLLAHELKIVERMDAQRDRRWFSEHSGEIAGKRLGIMGTGSIGQDIAKAAKSLGLSVCGLSRTGVPVDSFDNVFSINNLHDFLSNTDYLVSTLPRTTETDNLLDAEAFSHLPPHAYFVNVGRGNVVDDIALINALREGQLAGAALDVFDEEPVPQDSPLWDTPNLTITAHIAAVSHPSLIVPIFLENYRRYTTQQPLNFLVDFGTGY